MIHRYSIDVEHEGGADLSFVHFSDRPLMANEVVRDEGRDRSYVIVSVGDETSVDPLDPEIIQGSALARPVS